MTINSEPKIQPHRPHKRMVEVTKIVGTGLLGSIVCVEASRHFGWSDAGQMFAAGIGLLIGGQTRVSYASWRATGNNLG